MKNAIRSISFVLVLILAISYVYNVLSWKDTTGDYLSSVTQLYSTGDNLMDVVFLGSSHTYNGINPSVMWDEYGISAFDMSTSGQDRFSSYHYLVEVLKTQSPKVVLVDLYGLIFERNELQGNVYRNMLSMKTSRNSVELVNDYIAEEERLDYYLRWPIIHTRYRELGEYDFVQYSVSIFGRGESPSFNEIGWFEDSDEKLTKEVTKLSETNLQWLERMSELSEENKFDIIYFVAPFQVKESEQKILNGAKEYAAQKGISVYDFNLMADEINLDFNRDMSDAYHANASGAEKISLFFGELLSEEYNLTDHREDPDYYLWEEDLEYNRHLQIKNELSKTTDVVEYVELAKTLSDSLLIVSLEGNYEAVIPYLEELGIPVFEGENGGKWYYSDDRWIKIMDNTPGVEKYFEVTKYETISVRYAPTNLFANILLGRDSLITTDNGMNIVVYDKMTQELIGTKNINN